MKMPFLLKASLLLAILLPKVSHAQTDVAVSVDNFTGKANVFIPLITVTTGGLQLPVGIAYNGGGVKVRDIEGTAGMSWNLVAGGQVTRELRGLPDDCKSDGSQQVRLGWLYNTNGTKINNFTIANDNSGANCTDETTDLGYLNTNFSDLSDTEPDIFHVSAPGLSCNLVFDKDHNLKVFPYQDIKVAYETGVDDRIYKFTLTNDQGVVYDFSQQEFSSQTAVASTTPAYFKRYYNQFSASIYYVSAWKLVSITDLNKNSIKFSYLAGIHKTISIPMYLTTGGVSPSRLQFTKSIRNDLQIVNRIIAISDDDNVKSTLTFVYNVDASWPLINYIEGMGKRIQFGIFPVDPNNTPVKYQRNFLNDVNISGLDTIRRNVLSGYPIKSYKLYQQYYFNYAGLPDGRNVAIPDSSSREVDYWGYYNASGATSLIPQVYINPANSAKERYRSIAPGGSAADYPYLYAGANRAVNSATVANGALTTISYIDGGYTSITYEPNDFYDPTAGAVIQGGGIRVKQIASYDGLSQVSTLVKNYSYLNPATGLSSGKPVTMPVFAFTTPYTGSGTTQSKWENSTVRSETDLSSGDNSIIYSHVRVSQPGIGSTLSQYSVPATGWDASAAPDWAPTVINSARVGCGTATLVTNDKNTYPFPYNPNFGFERGLLLKSSAYNESGQIISQDSITYQRSFASPVVISGLSFDDNTSAVKNYAKYAVLAGTSKLTTQVISKLFDQGSTTLFRTKTTDYSYASANHKLPTATQTTNSDGSIIKNNIKYVKDYAATATADSANTALYNLALLNCNYPVEAYTQVTKVGVTKTTGGSLTKYKKYTLDSFTSFYLPWQKLSFVSAVGVTDFAPSAVSSGVFTADARYKLMQNNLLYNESGLLQSSADESRHVQTVVRNQADQLPVLNVVNARADEVAFSNFEDDHLPAVNFVTDTVRSLTAYTGYYSKVITPATELNSTLKKSSVTNNYIFSARVNSSVAGSLTVLLTGGTSSSKTLAYTAQPNKWVYYEVKVPATSLSANIAAKVTSNSNVLLDDVRLFPENAQVSNMGYDPLTSQMMSGTNTNGLTTYYTYDKKGRPRIVYDDDKNIVSKKTYVEGSSYGSYLTPVITYPSPGNYNNVSFLADSAAAPLNYNTEGLVYTWNFGDGSPAMTSKDIYGQVSHRYTAPGTYTVTTSKYSPIYGTKSSSRTITMADHSALPVTITKTDVTDGYIQSIKFYQGGVLKYTLSSSSMSIGASVPQGIYDVKVAYVGSFYNPSTFKGFKSVQCYASPVTYPGQGFPPPSGQVIGCAYYSSSPLSFRVNLNGFKAASFSMLITECSGIE